MPQRHIESRRSGKRLSVTPRCQLLATAGAAPGAAGPWVSLLAAFVTPEPELQLKPDSRRHFPPRHKHRLTLRTRMRHWRTGTDVARGAHSNRAQTGPAGAHRYRAQTGFLQRSCLTWKAHHDPPKYMCIHFLNVDLNQHREIF